LSFVPGGRSTFPDLFCRKKSQKIKAEIRNLDPSPPLPALGVSVKEPERLVLSFPLTSCSLKPAAVLTGLLCLMPVMDPEARTKILRPADVPTVLLDGKNTQSDRREVNRTVLSG